LESLRLSGEHLYKLLRILYPRGVIPPDICKF